jgi:hypothetical protein
MGKELLEGNWVGRAGAGFWVCNGWRAGLGVPVNQGNERQRNRRPQPPSRGKGGAVRGRGQTREVKVPPMPALGKVVRDCAVARQALVEGPNAVRDFWRTWDAEHGRRPDFGLWRQLREGDRFAGRLEGVVDLMGKALTAGDAQVRWGALALVPALPTRLAAGPLGGLVREAVRSPGPEGARNSLAWVVWLAGVWLGERVMEELRALVMEQEGGGWKVGRGMGFAGVRAEKWLPVSGGVFRCWVANAIEVLRESSGWLVTAWQLRRDARAAGAPRRADEVMVLLDAAALARREGQSEDGARLEALALALMPERVSEVLMGRGRVAAWRVAEAGLQTNERFPVRMEEMFFPGEPTESERGQETARLFADPGDLSAAELLLEVEGAGDWEKLRTAGVALRYPLAALAWVAKKAPHHVIKKQTELLEAGLRLAMKHHCLGSAGRMLAAWPGRAEMVVGYARAMRQSVRRMPVLRDWGRWREWAGFLRVAWGRLEAGAIADEETLFFLHETLLDREGTTRNCLPAALLEGDVAAAIEADPRLMSVLEHQRTLELWEVAALVREKAELAGWIWVSVVTFGEGAGGRYGALVLGAGGRRSVRGKLRIEPDKETEGAAAMMAEIATLAREVAGESGLEGVFLGVDGRLSGMDWDGVFEGRKVVRVASWEAAFRSVRETSAINAAG